MYVFCKIYNLYICLYIHFIIVYLTNKNLIWAILWIIYKLYLNFDSEIINRLSLYKIWSSIYFMRRISIFLVFSENLKVLRMHIYPLNKHEIKVRVYIYPCIRNDRGTFGFNLHVSRLFAHLDFRGSHLRNASRVIH